MPSPARVTPQKTWPIRARVTRSRIHRGEAAALRREPWLALLPPDVAVAHLPLVNLGPAQVQQIRRGQSVWLPRSILPDVAGECRMHDPTGELIGIGELNGGLLRPTKVLAG